MDVPPLDGLEKFITASIRGQDEAVFEFVRAIRLGWEGPARANRTRMFVILLGPTGTGKTEMTLLAAKYLFGQDAEAKSFARFDMAEYQHRDAIKKLLGSPDEKPLLGLAIDKLNANGGGLLLLDEIEKAEPNLVKVLLSFDAARSTMNDGETKDLSRIGVVMTSNLGSAEAAQMRNAPYNSIKRKILSSAQNFFSPEVLARFGARIVMNKLSFEVQLEIARALLAKELRIQSCHHARPILASDPEVLRFLVRKGFTESMGARNMRSTVENLIGAALLPRLHSRPDGDTIDDLWSRTLELAVQEDELVALPITRSEGFADLLSRLHAPAPLLRSA